jgi:adenosylmethionine-8-amino-7-oxononanoate aminotransferase
MHTAPAPLAVVGGEGAYLVDAEGRRILDGISSWWVNIHGHAHPRLNAALAAQAERLEHVLFAGCTHEPGALLAEELVARAPAGLERVFYSDDGSTAVEVALKMAWQAWRNRGETRRDLFVALAHAYHGDTFGAMAAGGVAAFHQVFAPLFCTVRRAHAPRCLAEPGVAEGGRCSQGCAGTVEEILAREGERVAAVLVEPMVQGAGGMLVHPPEFLRGVAAAARRHGVPWIADEVFTGFGRTGRMFACEHAAVAPDLMCVSKALTGGYLPLAATLATESIYQAFLSDERGRALLHGHSFTANPLACAVARESLRLFDETRCLERVAALERRFAARLAALAGHRAVAATRGLGAIAALELRAGEGGGYLSDLGPHLAARFLARGLLLRPLGDVIYFLPPYVVSDEDVERVFAAIGAELDALG